MPKKLTTHYFALFLLFWGFLFFLFLFLLFRLFFFLGPLESKRVKLSCPTTFSKSLLVFAATSEAYSSKLATFSFFLFNSIISLACAVVITCQLLHSPS